LPATGEQQSRADGALTPPLNHDRDAIDGSGKVAVVPTDVHPQSDIVLDVSPLLRVPEIDGADAGIVLELGGKFGPRLACFGPKLIVVLLHENSPCSPLK
jgi:hypothetical protein